MSGGCACACVLGFILTISHKAIYSYCMYFRLIDLVGCVYACVCVWGGAETKIAVRLKFIVRYVKKLICAVQ